MVISLTYIYIPSNVKKLFANIITPHIIRQLITRKQYICSHMTEKLLTLTLKKIINVFRNSTKISWLTVTLAY